MSVKLPNVQPQIVMYWNNESVYQPPATRTKTVSVPSGSQLVQAILMWNIVNKDPAAGINFQDIMFNGYLMGTGADSYADVTAYVNQNGDNKVEIDYSVPAWSQYSVGINASFAANVSLALYIVQSQPTTTTMGTTGDTTVYYTRNGDGTITVTPNPTGASDAGTVVTSGGSNTGTGGTSTFSQSYLGLPLWVWLAIAAAATVLVLLAVLMMRRSGSVPV